MALNVISVELWIRSIIRTEKRMMKIANSVRMTGWVEQYHIPRSQVWEGSRGGQKGNVHLHVAGHERISLASQRPPQTVIQRDAGSTLCGKLRGWMERDPKADRFVQRHAYTIEKTAKRLMRRGRDSGTWA